MELLIKIYVFLLGLAIGSFLNVLIYRLPRKLSVSKGHSLCPDCGHKLSWTDLFPVFSYLFLGGKCRYCKNRISFRYPLVELVNAACFLGVYWVYGPTLNSLIYALCCSCLIAAAFIDIDHMIIPDRFNFLIALCGLLLIFLSREPSWLDRIIGLFAVSLPLLVISAVTGGAAIGEGDIKLFAALGLLMGWKLILLSFLLASVFAALYGVTLMAMKKAGKKSQIPFGPFISFAAIAALIFGNGMLDFYFSFFR